MADFPDSTPAPEISRPFVEAEIERLIDILDTLDPDPDLENEGDDEPWLGAPDARTGSWSGLWPEGNDDREEDDSDREPCCEDEGAQCDDEGATEEDNGSAEDDFSSWVCVSREDSDETKKAAQVVVAHLHDILKRRQGCAICTPLNSARDVVTRIY